MYKKTIRIITKMGDSGMTSLGDGNRISKSSPRIAAMGDVDELNSYIGLILSQQISREIKEELVRVQQDLFEIGTCLANAEKDISEEKITRLELQAGRYDMNLLPLQGFILPGGTPEAALMHVARSICRRAERSVFIVSEKEQLTDKAGKYLNRLSDMLFIFARVINRQAGTIDNLWKKERT